MGWNSQNITSLLIITAGSGFTGLFIYSPTPGPGNLIGSIAAQGGIDPYGNSFTQGIWEYGSGASAGAAVGLQGQFLFLNDTTGATGSIEAAIIGGSKFLAFEAPPGGTGLILFLNAAGFVVATQPGSPPTPVPETWHNMALTAAFTAVAGLTPRFRLEPVGSSGVVRLDGEVVANGAQAAGTAIATLPAGYQPARQKQILGVATTGTVATGSFNISTGGVITCANATPNGDGIVFDGVTFPLD